MMPLLVVAVLLQHRSFASEAIEIRSVSPQTIGSLLKTGVRVEVHVAPDPLLVPESIRLFGVEDSERKLRKDVADDEVTLEGAIIKGEPLCTLRDDGNSRNGDERTGDDIYSCIAFVRPRLAGRILLTAEARYRPKSRPVSRASKTLSFADLRVEQSAEAIVRVVNGRRKTEDEADAHTDQIMRQANAIWQSAKQRYGLTDAAQAQAVRELRKLSGVARVELGRSGDIFISFTGGGRDQLQTFAPKE